MSRNGWVPAVCASTPTRLSSCGWARDIKLIRSLSKTFQSWNHQRQLWTQRVTLGWWLTDHAGTSPRRMSVNIQLSPSTPPCHSSVVGRSKEAPCHRATWWATANSSQPLADDDFDRPMLLRVTFLEPAQVWAIDHSLLLVHVCGTIYQFICGILN